MCLNIMWSDPLKDSHLYPLLSVVSNIMCNHIIPSTWNLFRCKNYKLCSRAGPQEDLTKDQIGTKVGEMTSLLRQDCVFCETWCEWDNRTWEDEDGYALRISSPQLETADITKNMALL